MKITFIVPNLNLSGGLRVVSIYAEYLSHQGHAVSVVTPSNPPKLKDQIKSLVKNKHFIASKLDLTFFNDPSYDVIILKNVNYVTAKDVPDSDIVIATFWNTAEWMAEYPASKGIKVYFLQHYEVFPWLPIERVKATLRMPYKKIAVANWIAEIIENEYGDPNAVVVPNGINPEKFYAVDREKQLRPTIGFLYNKEAIKGSDLALEAFYQAKKTLPQLQLVILSSTQLAEPPENSLYFYRPDQEQLREIYSLCDVWLFSSRSEGFGLPILEAMACRTPVVGTRCGVAPDIINNENGRLIDIDDLDAMVTAICEIVTFPKSEWHKMSEAAYTTSTKWHWQNACKQFEATLLSYLEEEEPSGSI